MKKYKVDQNFAESALPARGIVIFVKLLMKFFDSRRFSSPFPLVGVIELHDVQLQGSLRCFNSFERNFSAGPSFIPRILIKCSSVSNCSPSPSMLCSRKFCEWEEKNFIRNVKWVIAIHVPEGLHHEFYINFFSQPSSDCNFLFITFRIHLFSFCGGGWMLMEKQAEGKSDKLRCFMSFLVYCKCAGELND